MDRIKQLRVFYHERKVGTLALYKKVFLPKTDPFGGLFGVFADSIVGDLGVGALSYRPEMQLPAESSTLGLDQLAGKEYEKRRYL